MREGFFEEGKVVWGDDLEGHSEVFLVDGFANLVIDGNLIFPIPHVHEHTVVVAALGLTHEVLAVLHRAEEHFHPLPQVIKRLSKLRPTRKATAASSAVA